MMRCLLILCFVVNLILMTTKKCHSWNFNSLFEPQFRHNHQQRQHNRQEQQNQQQQEGINPGGTSRRQVLYESIITGCAATFPLLSLPQLASAYDDDNDDGNNNKSLPTSNGVVTVRIESPDESLGIELYETKLRGTNIIAIRRIVVPNKRNKFLREGMILLADNKSYSSSKELVQKLRSGPFPIELNFFNLAAGGDAISDLGTSIVSPKDALELAQKMDDDDAKKTIQQQPQQQQMGKEYSITTTRQRQQPCAMQSRRNDVLEIDYEASYVDNTGTKVVYDASAFRGTGNRPYQMVLGSGDMIPGVDQGLYDMCPGDERILNIPPVLGHGPKSRKLFRIPDYLNLEWKINLVSIDGTIREDNNVISRDEREGRFSY